MTDTMTAPPTDNLVRKSRDPKFELRAVADPEEGMTGECLTGYLARFNEWTEIYSYWEGRFMERIAPGAFARTIGENEVSGRVKVLYDHGHDPSVGNKPLGPIDVLEEDGIGARYEVPLIAADYNTGFVIPAARQGLLGSSFRFRATAETWVEPADATEANPNKLKERTVNEVDLYEFGPVTFPAYQGADAGLRFAMRSATDDWFDALRSNPLFVSQLTERLGSKVMGQILETLQSAPVGTPQRDEAAVGPDEQLRLQTALIEQRRRRKG